MASRVSLVALASSAHIQASMKGREAAQENPQPVRGRSWWVNSQALPPAECHPGMGPTQSPGGC